MIILSISLGLVESNTSNRDSLIPPNCPVFSSASWPIPSRVFSDIGIYVDPKIIEIAQYYLFCRNMSLIKSYIIYIVRYYIYSRFLTIMKIKLFYAVLVLTIPNSFTCSSKSFTCC